MNFCYNVIDLRKVFTNFAKITGIISLLFQVLLKGNQIDSGE